MGERATTGAVSEESREDQDSPQRPQLAGRDKGAIITAPGHPSNETPH
jgi:hypothetical protein